jgi:integrase
MSERKNLTKRIVETLPIPDDGEARPITYDEQVRGLGVVVQPSGKKSFVWLRKVRGKVVWKTIADWPEMSIEDARAAAGEWNIKRANWKKSNYSGPSPFAASPTHELTLEGLMNAYIEQHMRAHAKRPEKAEKYLRWMINYYVPSWKDRRLGDITAEEISAWHFRAGTKHGQRSANYVTKTLRRLYRFAGRARLFKGEIPTAGIQFFHEHKRTRFLQPDELPKLWTALRDAPNPDLRDYVNLALWTGARKTDVLSMRWQDVDLASNRWMIPDPKNRTPYIVPLTPEAVSILETRFESRTEGEQFVFPGVGRTGHLVDLKGAWDKLLQAAGLHHPGDPELKITQHDLRRTHGSWMAIQGTSLPIIGKALGHTSTAATQIYARLHLDPVRAAMESANRAIGEAMQATPPKMLRPAPEQRAKAAQRKAVARA